jgi:hypothetical protein
MGQSALPIVYFKSPSIFTRLHTGPGRPNSAAGRAGLAGQVAESIPGDTEAGGGLAESGGGARWGEGRPRGIFPPRGSLAAEGGGIRDPMPPNGRIRG